MLSTLRANAARLQLLSSSKFSVQATVNSNFLKFRREYDQQVASFQTKVRDFDYKTQGKVEKPKVKGYTHPYNSDHHPLNFSAVKLAEYFHDFIGPEQVSPHYENFLTSRKYLMAFWGAFFVLNFGIATVDLNWIAKSAFIPLVFYTSYLYFYMEGRKSFMKPLLQRFYRRVAANEMFLFETYYHENIENKVRENLRAVKNQLEYWEVHASFPNIKTEAINNFLANQYYELQHHLVNRSLNILRQTQQFEKQNQTRQLQKLVQSALEELEASLKGPNRDAVQKEILDAAIEGLSKGYMDYAKDPLLPLILKRIEKEVQSIKNLSPVDQAKLVQLTQDQLEQIRRVDQAARNEFLTKEPVGLDASLKNNETAKKILEKWGK